MNKPFKNIRKEQIFAVILWAIALAVTIIIVYMYYDQKIEQLEQSIDKQSEPVSHRISALPVRPLQYVFSGGKSDLEASGAERKSSKRHVVTSERTLQGPNGLLKVLLPLNTYRGGDSIRTIF